MVPKNHIPIHMVERDTQLPQDVFRSVYVFCGKYMYTHIHKIFINLIRKMLPHIPEV